ncbi:DUF2860 domain-containing protein [Motilimonas cestriensis]|uniref:DUF2860 domain-containing protein n=1 Tax=Motilimonas cestriensis TaxID=2742685 RepID=A0ABS8W9J2_9GAMM|nr:DUF2860 family protein [Motilimonas cestriensis]MCE2594469.1 DUF2860 domain-containing protein [Motilimonas cestriensis]
MSRIIHSLLASSLLLASQQSVADLAEPGVDFVLNINGGGGQAQSQSNTDKDNAITKDLNNAGKKQTAASAFVLGRLSYTLMNKKTQFFLGNSEDSVVVGDFKAELGISQEFDNGTIVTLAYIPMLAKSEAWKDPFITNVKRTTTDVESQGARVRFENLFSQPLTFEYTWAEANFEHEHSGQHNSLNLSSQQQALLKRDADYHQVYLDYTYALNEQFAIQPSVTFTRGESDGKAMAFDQGEFQASFISQLSPQSQLVSSLSYSQASYDKSHPIFNKIREDKSLGAFLFYSYAQPFNWDNTTFTAMAFYGQQDSNINFYDEDGAGASVGVVYSF